jgi:hypothetical protein
MRTDLEEGEATEDATWEEEPMHVSIGFGM